MLPLHAATLSVCCRSYSRKMDMPISPTQGMQRSLKSCWPQWMSLFQATPSQSLRACHKCLRPTASMQRCSPSLCIALAVLQQIKTGVCTALWMRTVIPTRLRTTRASMDQALKCSHCRRRKAPHQSTRYRVLAQFGTLRVKL